MGLIARIKDRLFDRRNVIEIESLEEDGQSVSLGDLKNTTLYSHSVTIEYNAGAYTGSFSLYFINNKQDKIIIDDFTAPDSDHRSKLKILIYNSIIAYYYDSNIPYFAKSIFTANNDTDLKRINLDITTGEISIINVLSSFPTKVLSVNDVVTKI